MRRKNRPLILKRGNWKLEKPSAKLSPVAAFPSLLSYPSFSLLSVLMLKGERAAQSVDWKEEFSSPKTSTSERALLVAEGRGLANAFGFDQPGRERTRGLSGPFLRRTFVANRL